MHIDTDITDGSLTTVAQTVTENQRRKKTEKRDSVERKSKHAKRRNAMFSNVFAVLWESIPTVLKGVGKTFKNVTYVFSKTHSISALKNVTYI